MFHTLAGTGGTYGFYELSRQSRKGEWMCETAVREHRPIAGTQLAALRALLKELEACLVREKSDAAAAMQALQAMTMEVPAIEVVVLEWFDEARAGRSPAAPAHPLPRCRRCSRSSRAAAA